MRRSVRWWCRLAILAGVWLPVAACGARRAGSEAGAAEQSDVITEAELQEATASNLYDFVRARRPRWLQRSRPSTVRPEFETGVIVYVDNVRFGGAESLRQIALRTVASARYLGPSEAHAEFGPGHLNGVIQVRTR